MNTNHIEGELKNGAGKAEALAAQVLDDPDMELDGEARRAEGDMQQMIGDVQDKITRAADKVATTAVKVGEQARDTYANVTIRVQRVADQVDPFIKEQPYLALGLAAVGGLMFGLLYAGRGPKIVYVKPHA
jgi:uncharacterized protein YjbJ (UPF0337 family)